MFVKSCRSVLSVAVTAAMVLFALPVHADSVTKQDVEAAANAGDFDKAYELLVQLAESGHAQAQGFLAYVLYEGEWDVPVDEVQAKAWMQKAFDQNDAYAHLFVALTNAPDVREENASDPSLIKTHDWKTNVWFAAESGHPYAQHMVGDWAKSEYKYDEAMDWYNKAAQPDRGYYFVDYFITMSLYTFPKRFLLDEIELFVDSGNPRGFSILHAAYALGIDTGEDYEVAYEYGVISKVLGETLNHKAISLVMKNTSEKEREKLGASAKNYLMSLLANKKTYMGQSFSWCDENQDSSLSCLRHAVERHRTCEIPYVLWNFTHFTGYPAYKACRLNLQQSEN